MPSCAHLMLETVVPPVAKFDRGRLDTRNIPGVVAEVTQRGTCNVQTRHEMVNTVYCRNHALKAD